MAISVVCLLTSVSPFASRYLGALLRTRSGNRPPQDDKGNSINAHWYAMRIVRSMLHPGLSVVFAAGGAAVGSVVQSTLTDRRAILATAGELSCRSLRAPGDPIRLTGTSARRLHRR